MSSLFVVQAALFLFGFNLEAPVPHFNVTEVLSESIVMENDVILITTTDGSNGDIVQIDIYDTTETLVLGFSGCYDTICRSDLGSLSSDTYHVVVTTDTSYEFSDDISI